MYEPETVAIGADPVEPKPVPFWQTLTQNLAQYFIAREQRRAGVAVIPTLPEGAHVVPPPPTYKPSYTPLIIGGGVLLGVLAFTMLKPKKRGRRR